MKSIIAFLYLLNSIIVFAQTGMKVVKHDGSQHHGVGIQPNVFVSKTIGGVREGKDEFLEKALELAEH